MMMLGTGTNVYNFGRRGGEFENCVDSWITVGQGYFLVSWSLRRGINYDDDDQEDIGWENLRREPPPAELLRLSIAFWKLKSSDKYFSAYLFSWGVIIHFFKLKESTKTKSVALKISRLVGTFLESQSGVCLQHILKNIPDICRFSSETTFMVQFFFIHKKVHFLPQGIIHPKENVHFPHTKNSFAFIL